MIQNLNKPWPCGFKLAWGIGWTFVKALKSLKIFTLTGSFCRKRNVLARKCQRNYVSWRWKVMQNLRGNWLVAWKMRRNLVNFHASSWKSENLHLMGSFCRNIYSFRWKGTEELFFMTLETDTRFEEKLTLGFKNDMRNLVNFNASSGKSENFHFDVLLLSIEYKV